MGAQTSWNTDFNILFQIIGYLSVADTGRLYKIPSRAQHTVFPRSNAALD